MSDNKLNLTVQFMALDNLSSTMKGIIGLGKTGKQEFSALKKEMSGLTEESVKLKKSLNKAFQNPSGNLSNLIERERELKAEMARVNQMIEQRARLNAIDARTSAIKQRGSQLVSEGQAGLMTGAFLMAPAYMMAKAGGEMQAMENQLRVMGLGTGAVKDLRAYAEAMHVAGSSVKDNLRYIVEAQGAFRETGEHSMAEQLVGAKLMAPLMAKLMTTSKALGHELSEDQEKYFLRFIEQAGGLNSPQRAAQLTDGLFRALQSSGGNVNPANYQSFLARAGIAGQNLSSRAMFADFEPLIAEMHDSAGVGLQTAYKQATGIKANSRAAAEFLKLGVWDKNKVILNNLGGVKSTTGNPLTADAAKLMATDPVEFYRKVILPAYQKAGITDHQRENAVLFGGTGGTLFNLIDKQMPTLLKSRAGYEKTQGLQQAYGQTQEGFFGQQGKMRVAWQDFMVTAGTKGGLLDSFTLGLRAATSLLRTFTGFANGHPTAFKFLTTGIVGLIGMRTGLAVAKLAFGGLLGPVGKLWDWWSKYRELGTIAAVFPRMAKGVGIARFAFKGLWSVTKLLGSETLTILKYLAVGAIDSFKLLGTGVMMLGKSFLRAGAMMLANPMVLIIGGIVLAVAGAAYLIWKYHKQIMKAFGTAWTWIKGTLSSFVGWVRGFGQMIMDGLVSKLNPTIFAHKMVDMAKGGLTAFKNFFHIRSPSRVMMEMGGHIVAGLGHGIDQNAQRPLKSILRVGAAMTGALAVSAPAMAAHGGGMIGKVEIHIHQNQGESVQALAERVATVLQRQQRRAAGARYDD